MVGGALSCAQCATAAPRCFRSTASTRPSFSACRRDRAAWPGASTTSCSPRRAARSARATLARLEQITPDEACAHPELGDGAQDLGRLGHHDEQGARSDRGALAVRPAARADSRRDPPAEHRAFDGRVPRRFGARAARHAGHEACRSPTACPFRERIESGAPRWTSLSHRAAHFEAADARRFPGLHLAYDALRGPDGSSRRAERRQRRGRGRLPGRHDRLSDIHRVNDGTLDAVVPAACGRRGHRRAARARRRARAVRAHGRVKELATMITVLAFLVTLGVLIVVHEWGHYRVARACGVKVLRFSVGFGRVVCGGRARRDDTEFVVAALPLGRLRAHARRARRPGRAARACTGVQQQAAGASVPRSWPQARPPICCSPCCSTPAPTGSASTSPRPCWARRVAGSLAERAGLRAGDWVRALRRWRRSWDDLASLTELRWQVTQAALRGEPLQLAGHRCRRPGLAHA